MEKTKISHLFILGVFDNFCAHVVVDNVDNLVQNSVFPAKSRLFRDEYCEQVLHKWLFPVNILKNIVWSNKRIVRKQWQEVDDEKGRMYWLNNKKRDVTMYYKSFELLGSKERN